MQDRTAAYDQLYAGGYRSTLRDYEVARWHALTHFVRRVARVRTVRSVLDYGCGRGLYLPLWEELFPQAVLSACDVSRVALDQLATQHPKHAARAALIEGGRAPFDDGSQDVVTSVEVMEHVHDLGVYLSDVRRVLAPGGAFIWTTPCANMLSLEHTLSLLTSRIEPTHEGFRRWTWEDPGHVRRLRSREAKRILEDHGFRGIRFRFRAHLFAFPLRWLDLPDGNRWRQRLLRLDYDLFRRVPNGASMIGLAYR